MSEKSRYKWLIRPLIHRNAIASLDWIGKSAPVPLRYLERERTEGRKREKFYICLDVTHTHFLREPAQSKCTWTFQKSCFIRKFTGTNAALQKRDPHFVRACAVEMHINMSQEPLYTEIYRKNGGAQMEHPDQAPAFTPTVRTPQCGHAVWGKITSDHWRGTAVSQSCCDWRTHNMHALCPWISNTWRYIAVQSGNLVALNMFEHVQHVKLVLNSLLMRWS